MTLAPRRHRHTALRRRAAAASAAALVLLSACSDNKTDQSGDKNPTTAVTPSTAPRKTPQTPSADAAEKAAVLASYNAMWVEQMKAYRKADAAGTELEKYASLDALGKFRIDLAQMKKAGTAVMGELGHTPVVTSLNLTTQTPTAELSDCMDLSESQTIDTRAGNKVIPYPTAQPMRYIATATAEKWPSGWMITKFIPTGSRRC
ncbi:hypothetical protein GCM10010331_69260 [Streptomyces xanthochromogenes]|uniref:hypothetical protein n=1 Tax=Streptomyces xanthochromogenes TaxID=67384 RepID=UPI001672BA98|nr:hypothetical protein [Streptomyces xanthochromogenes]GHB71494.1 hypothetical protein GCM10010331_69260 [Streptomyces xanthochromogenes]